MFKLIMFIELCKISKLVMHLNSCSMDLGRDSLGEVGQLFCQERYEKMKTEIALNLFKEVATRWIEDLSRSVEH